MDEDTAQRLDNDRVSEKNIEIVRDAYDAFGRGDYETSLSCYDPHVEFSQPADEPGGGTYYGVDGVVRAFSSWLGAWEDYRVEVEQLTGYGPHVLARTRHFMRGKGSGAAVERLIFQLWTLRNGLVVRQQMYYDEAEAVAAAEATNH